MNRAAQYESKQKKALDLLGRIRGSSGSSSRGLKISDDSSHIEITSSSLSSSSLSSSLSSSSSSSTTSSMQNVVSPDNGSASAMTGVSHIKQHESLKGDPSLLLTDDDSDLYYSANSLPLEVLCNGSRSSSVNDDDDDEDEQDRSSDPLDDEELIKVCIIVVGDVCISCW